MLDGAEDVLLSQAFSPSTLPGDARVLAILVHALHDQARQFYLSRGFVQSRLQPMTLMMTMATVRTILTEPEKGIRAGPR